MFECRICGSKHERFKTIEGMYSHLEKVHGEDIPDGWSVQQYAYYLKTGKTHGNCVICKGKTKFNPATGKYYRLCGRKACSDKNREIFKNRMIGKYGKVSLLDDPEQQKKMLANRKISGTYTWSDGKKFTYTGSYELDFLRFLDVFLNFPSQDIECPSPHTYYYEYEGKKHFYIPDVYIQSLNLEIEVKDGGNNPNTHHKIQEVDKIKEALKDKVMLTQSAVSYVKVTNKEYDTFFKYLYKMKDQYNDKDEKFKPIFILGESAFGDEFTGADVLLEAPVDTSTGEYVFYVSSEPGLKTIRPSKSKAYPNLGEVIFASPFKEFATALGANLTKDHIKMISTVKGKNVDIKIELLDKYAPVENKFFIYVLSKEDFEPLVKDGVPSKVRYYKQGDAEVIREIKVTNWRRYINRFPNVKLINFPNDEEAKEIEKEKMRESYEFDTVSECYNGVYESFVLESGVLNRMREIIGGYNWKRKVKNRDFEALTKNVTPYVRKEVHSKSFLDRFYRNNDFFIECVSGNEQLCQILANMLAAHYKVKTPVEVYVTTGKDMNKIYDLAGNNAYQNDVHHVIIPLNTLKNSRDIVYAKATLRARYFNDVVDNNEYREYLAGRHERTKEIEWLIKQHGLSDKDEEKIAKKKVKESSMGMDTFTEIFGEGRDATAEEQQSVMNHIERISEETGINFWDEETVNAELVTEEARYSSTNKYPVFIVLMHSGTVLANVIKAFTRDEFSHACISFNSKLDPLYSFGNKKVDIIDPGFVIQSPKSEFYKKHIAYYNVFVMYVNKSSYDKMQEKLEFFIENKDDLKYDLASLFKIACGKPSEESKKYFCSKFCMNVIGAGRELEKVPSLWKPEDMKYLDDISLVDKGFDFSYYDYRKTEKNLEKIKKHQLAKESLEIVDEASFYYRVTYNGNGIYEEYKKLASMNQWKSFKDSEACEWLPVPPSYSNDYTSYFTDKGYKMFKKLTYPELIKVLDEDSINTVKIEKLPKPVYKDKYQVVCKESFEEVTNEIMNEAYIKNEKDIYYNKDKFDSGEINLCFITGHSGSGKSTMARNMTNKSNIEHYELDDVIANWNFSDDNLKDYGNLIYSFFRGVGKKFRYKSRDEWSKDTQWYSPDNGLFNDKYERELTQSFVRYSKSYAKSHKNVKIILEGIWLFHYVEPSAIEDCAVYVKGTSITISKIRAAKRDSSDARNKVERAKAFTKMMLKPTNWKFYLLNEKKVVKYRNYFRNKIKDTAKESTLTTEERNDLSGSDYGIPILKKYPMPDEAHVKSAIRFFNYVDEEYEELLAENIKKKIKEFNMEVNVGKKNRLTKYL